MKNCCGLFLFGELIPTHKKKKKVLGQHKEKNHSEITNELTEIFWYGLGVFFFFFFCLVFHKALCLVSFCSWAKRKARATFPGITELRY